MAQGYERTRKKLIFLLSITAALLVFSTAYVIGGTQAYTHYQQNKAATQKHCGDSASVHICVISPTTIFSSFYPSYLDNRAQHALFSVEYTSNTPITLLVSVSVTEFSQTETRNVKANSTTQTATFLPPLLKQGQVLQNLTREVSTSLHVQVVDTNKHPYYVNDIPLALQSRLIMQWTAANRLRIAAWITPNDSMVSELVKVAAGYLQNQRPPVPAGMVGYKATSQQVVDQVDAIYDAMWKHYHLQYVQENVPYTGINSTSSTTQTIKLPHEVLQQGSGMCVEFTNLLASAVEKIGLHAEIVIIPGHAFLGVATLNNNTSFQYWDAVDINNGVAADSANVAGDKLYQENVQRHTIVDAILVSDARNAGVGPML